MDHRLIIQTSQDLPLKFFTLATFTACRKKQLNGCLRKLQDYSYHGPFVPWTIRSIDYSDNIFCFIKAETVQSNHLLLDAKSNNCKI